MTQAVLLEHGITQTGIRGKPKMKKPKLSPAQQKVMLWLSQGWSARVSHGSAVEINGKRICNVDTMTALVRLGLVERDSQPPYWMATAEGMKLSPNYCPPDDDE